MNDQAKKAWEALLASAGYGSLLPGPRVVVTDPTFVDNAAEVVVPVDTPEVVINLTDAGASNTLTITLPTSLKCIGKAMVLSITQAGEACTIALANILEGYGSDEAAGGVYLLQAVQVGGGVVWIPIAPDAITGV